MTSDASVEQICTKHYPAQRLPKDLEKVTLESILAMGVILMPEQSIRFAQLMKAAKLPVIKEIIQQDHKEVELYILTWFWFSP
jgi:hypothetical protein